MILRSMAVSEANLSVLLAAAAGAVTSVLAGTAQNFPYLANIKVTTAIHHTLSLSQLTLGSQNCPGHLIMLRYVMCLLLLLLLLL